MENVSTALFVVSWMIFGLIGFGAFIRRAVHMNIYHNWYMSEKLWYTKQEKLTWTVADTLMVPIAILAGPVYFFAGIIWFEIEVRKIDKNYRG